MTSLFQNFVYGIRQLRRNPAAEQARREALIKLGGVEQAKQVYRVREGLRGSKRFGISEPPPPTDSQPFASGARAKKAGSRS